VRDGIAWIQEYFFFCLRTFASLFRRPFYFKELVEQMDTMGVASLPIILLTGISTGGILALQGAISLEPFGVKSLIANAVTVTLVRELGPVLGSLLVAGRVGAGISSQLGSMQVSSQIDAMRTLGTDPYKKLVIPRVVGLTIMLPMLVIICDFAGTFGGFLIARYSLQLNSAFYWSSVINSLYFNDIVSGMIKPVIFGFFISSIACFMGLRARGGTAGVGEATTNTVVIASVLILVSDFILSKVFFLVLK
jgi:phospholipid/cholesterol/gamma-HCH transport system permease protein